MGRGHNDIGVAKWNYFHIGDCHLITDTASSRNDFSDQYKH
ncbi:MAG: hypothetical protein ACLQHW_17190 [bacterium]